jgi:hypothetical protein
MVFCTQYLWRRQRLTGFVQNFGTWMINESQVVNGSFSLSLWDANGREKASDSVPVR